MGVKCSKQTNGYKHSSGASLAQRRSLTASILQGARKDILGELRQDPKMASRIGNAGEDANADRTTAQKSNVENPWRDV
jgi:hypothetical protein